MALLTDTLYLRLTFFTHKGDYPLVRRDYGSTSGMVLLERVTEDLITQFRAFCLRTADFMKCCSPEREPEFKDKEKQ